MTQGHNKPETKNLEEESEIHQDTKGRDYQNNNRKTKPKKTEP